MTKEAFSISDKEYRAIYQFLKNKTGLNLHNDKKEELLEIIRDRLANYGKGTFREYFKELRDESCGERELRSLVSRLTVGETHFFRNRPHFQALTEHILPELVRQRRKASRRLRIWSAGCSTGEEPYSLAMNLLDMIPDLENWSISLLATDLNEDALSIAKEGLYRKWSFREVDNHYFDNYFVPEGAAWRVRPQVKQLVDFRFLNLADDLYPAASTGTDSMDLIVCRNVMIYFNIDLCREITRRFYKALSPDGFLLVGHSEHQEMIYSGFQRKTFGRAIFYRKGHDEKYLKKGLQPRFRGSGEAREDLLTHEAPGDKKREIPQRPSTTEETVLFEKGVELYRKMAVAESISTFNEVLEINPVNERALYMVSLMMANSGDIPGAEKNILRLLAANPLHIKGIYLQAIIHREKGEKDEELAALKKTVYVNQRFVLGHFQMGMYYMQSGNRRLGERSFRNALKVLARRSDDDSVDGVDGLTVGRLKGTIETMCPEALSGGE